MNFRRPAFVLATLSALYAASSCSGEDGKKKEMGASGAGGQAGSGGGNSGGSSSGKGGTGGGGNGGSAGQSQAGAAGEAPGGAGGEGGVSGEGGMGGEAIGGTAGAGGGKCGDATDATCIDIMELWNPRFDGATGEFRFDMNYVNADIVTGTVTYYEWTFDVDTWVMNGCANLDGTSLRMEGSDLVISIGGSASERVTINYLSLLDACGNEYNLVVNGVGCTWLEFQQEADGGTLWQVGCPDGAGSDCQLSCS